MSKFVTNKLTAILKNNPWTSEVAGILPLSALIDFIDIPLKIHTLQLTGAVPLWSWAITPSGSRILLNGSTSKTCYLDQPANSPRLTALDGRWGDQFLLPNPETIRICIGSQAARSIQNPHANLRETPRTRIWDLEVIRVRCLHDTSEKGRLPPRESSTRSKINILADPLALLIRRYSIRYWATTLFGWTSLSGLIILSIFSRCYLAVAFLVVVVVSGAVVTYMHGKELRPYVLKTSSHDRVVVVIEDKDANDCKVFYGDVEAITKLLHQPLRPNGTNGPFLRMALRGLILGQWGLAIATAASKDWNAYFITFWIIFGIFAQSYLIPPQTEVRQWMKSSFGIRMERYSTQLSSKSAFLATIVALNPDASPSGAQNEQKDGSTFSDDAFKWINYFRQPSMFREIWDAAVRAAVVECGTVLTGEQLKSPKFWESEGSFMSEEWRTTYAKAGNHQLSFICEGICMAAKIRLEAAILESRSGGNAEGEVLESQPDV